MPTVTSTTAMNDGHLEFHVTKSPYLNQANHQSTSYTTLDLEWVLFDGGVRIAGLEAARELLISQEANHNANLLLVFTDTVAIYFQVVTDEAAAQARRDAEQAAESVYRVTNGRYKGGVAPPSDVLQARTILAQATLDRIRAEGTLAADKGRLAIAIGLPVNTTFSLEQGDLPSAKPRELEQVDILMRYAVLHHPSVLAAAANYRSQQAQTRAAENAGLPVLSLTSRFSLDDNVGQVTIPQRSTEVQDTIGIKLRIPLSVLDRSYEIRKARAEELRAAAQLAEVERTTSSQVWESYLRLKTDFESAAAADELVASSQKSFSLAQGRYKNGIGSILEVINAEVSLANANQQRIAIRSACVADRLKLSASLGKLALSAGEN